VLEEGIRPNIKSRSGGDVVVDRHKIASLSELLIVRLQPIEHEDPDNLLTLNARLAYFVAINIIANWNPENVEKLEVSKSFNREHLTWLKYVANGVAPASVFSNSATWYLVERIFLERFERTHPI
jgi:hypothetical protein